MEQNKKGLSVWEKLVLLVNVLFIFFFGMLSLGCLPAIVLAFPDAKKMLEPAIVLCYFVCLVVCVAKSRYRYRFDLILMPLAFISHGTALSTVAVLYLVILLIAYPSKPKKIKQCSPHKQSELKPTSVKPVLFSQTITPLLNAILSAKSEAVQVVLFEHPEHLNTAYAQNGNTPLHVAALNGYTEIVKLLLAQPGIDKTRKNNEGKTARDLAQERNFPAIAELLK